VRRKGSAQGRECGAGGTLQDSLVALERALHRKALLRSVSVFLSEFRALGGQVPLRMLRVDEAASYARPDVLDELEWEVHRATYEVRKSIDSMLDAEVGCSHAGIQEARVFEPNVVP
jgi:hypothetical protein